MPHWPGNLALGLLKAYSRVAPTERGGFRLVRIARRLVPRHAWQRDFVTPDRSTLRLDLSTYPDCCMAVGLYELDTYRILRRHLRPGGWFVDVGANIGYFTTLAAKWTGPTGRVDAIEPDPLNRQRLESNLRASGVAGRVHVHPVAAAEQSGDIQLYHPTTDAINHGQASTIPALVPGGRPHTVRAVRLDELLPTLVPGRNPDVIKLDVEGAELSALKGLHGVLASANPPRLILEHNPASCHAAGYKPSDLLRQLMASQPRYRVHWIGWRLSRINSPDALDAGMRQGNLLAEAP